MKKVTQLRTTSRLPSLFGGSDILGGILLASALSGCTSNHRSATSAMEPAPTLRIATFNVSMEADNYLTSSDKTSLSSKALEDALASGDHPQIKNIAEIIQRVRPDIILLNEFDFIADPNKGIHQFIKGYLHKPQNNQQPIRYPYLYLSSVNTGVATPFQSCNSRLTHYGFGNYPGQYGMVLLSRYPFDVSSVRTFKKFLWRDMPDNLMPTDGNGEPWYSPKEIDLMRLSSKSHWDTVVNVCGIPLHVLASHPTPPVFDGKEDRNGKRNYDELRFWRDYIEGDRHSYHYDDQGQKGGITDKAPFVILGDLNANDLEGQAYPGAISQLLEHPNIAKYPTPTSKGAAQHKTESEHAAIHTTHWGMRADYVLPSNQLNVMSSGVFWPAPDSENARLVSSREASSDHRLVWVDIEWPLVNCSRGF